MNITPSSRNNRHLILFNVAPYCFCAPAAAVESIIMLPPVSRLPMAPPSVIGLINHRGQVYRVISLRRKLGLETGSPRMEGQLMLTNLSIGLTAFLVDEVVDVLPDTDLPRRPLSPRSAMDLFDAFILREEQILFHTTFDLLDQARETAYPNADLPTLDRMAAATWVPTTAPDPSTTPKTFPALDGEEINRAVAPEKRPGRETIRPELAPGEDHTTFQETRITRPYAFATETPVIKQDQSLSRHRPDRTASDKRPKRSPASPARTRRFALALTGVLLLILIVILSSGVLLRRHMVAVQPHLTRAQVTSRPSVTPQKALPEPPPATRRTQSSAEDVSGDQPPHSASDTPPTAPPTRMRQAASPAATSPQEEPALPQTIAKKEARASAEEASGSSQQILRMETESFTLMVERPARDQQNQPEPLLPQNQPAGAKIVHRVVPGDTLWDIAEHYLGDPFQYPELARLSQIRNPDLIYPGDIIRIIKKER